jgi:DNA invertase Pin-like site-specific DNA recombinase
MIMKIARIYLRVSTNEQDLTRQADVEQNTRAAGYYIAGVYREKASGIHVDRPELLRMIADLQPGEVVVAEKMDRISRLPLAEAEKLVAAIRAKGAKLAVPGIVDLSEFAADADGVAKIVLESVQELLLKLSLQMARDDYEIRRERQRQGVQLAKALGKYAGRRPDTTTHKRIVTLRGSGHTIKLTAELTGCSESQVKRIWAIHRAKPHPTGSVIGDDVNHSKK